ncbi:MAG: CoA transferase [Acidimicrobiaceae bacterium]|nr:CoA transferase [Acidimicrobiaceae bacterium]|tara:strand:- start:2093 stop:3328 length:1236 start_codon:yes stop_codon:yes gene_type:complete
MNQRFNDPQTVLIQLCEELSHDVKGVASRWAMSGAMSLTGESSGPPRQVPVGVTLRMEQLATIIGEMTGLSIDGPALLGERAAIAGYTRQGNRSVGGHAQLVESIDKPICINFARPDDLLLIPAWLQEEIDPNNRMEVLSSLKKFESQQLMKQADLLGIPLGVPDVEEYEYPAYLTEGKKSKKRAESTLVIEFGSLWASPLCGDLLRRSGCRVIKIESLSRPDGARRGPPGFFDLLNGGKESLALDFKDDSSLKFLRKIVKEADVIVEGSRPRALRQLGVDAETEVENGKVWVSITGYGRTGPRSKGVAFGDDAAVSGGLFLKDPLSFIADAVADPSAGLLAAVIALSALESEKGWLIDVPLSAVANWICGIGEVPKESERDVVAEPRARKIKTKAPEIGQHNSELENEFS